MLRFILIALAVNFGFNLSYAETVKLKDGRTFTGPIIERSSDYVVIFYRNVPLKYYLDQVESIDENSKIDLSDLEAQGRLKAVENRSDSEIAIPVQAPAEFDFKTKQEIYAIRQESVLQYPQFAPADYKPSEAVFGQIKDNRPWWGLLGLSYYGPGQNSIIGASDESRYIINPFILAGLDHSLAYTEENRSFPAVPIYPEPVFLYMNKSGSSGRVIYNLGSFWSRYKKYYPFINRQREVTLIAYNARDLGYNYISIVPEESRNVESQVSLKNVIELIQFIHCGGSCGYPGGCNNMSPNQAEMNIKVRSLPARICLKLWKLKPAAFQDKPDIIFTIDMI